MGIEGLPSPPRKRGLQRVSGEGVLELLLDQAGALRVPRQEERSRFVGPSRLPEEGLCEGGRGRGRRPGNLFSGVVSFTAVM